MSQNHDSLNKIYKYHRYNYEMSDTNSVPQYNHNYNDNYNHNHRPSALVSMSGSTAHRGRNGSIALNTATTINTGLPPSPSSPSYLSFSMSPSPSSASTSSSGSSSDSMRPPTTPTTSPTTSSTAVANDALNSFLAEVDEWLGSIGGRVEELERRHRRVLSMEFEFEWTGKGKAKGNGKLHDLNLDARDGDLERAGAGRGGVLGVDMVTGTKMREERQEESERGMVDDWEDDNEYWYDSTHSRPSRR